MLSEALRHHALLLGPGIFIPCQLFTFQETLAFRNPKAIWNFWFCRSMWMGQKRLLSTNSWRPAKEEESWVIVSSGTLASFWWTKRGMLLTATHLPPLPSRLRWNPRLSVLSTSCFWCIVVSCSYTPGNDLEPFNIFLFPCLLISELCWTMPSSCQLSLAHITIRRTLPLGVLNPASNPWIFCTFTQSASNSSGQYIKNTGM